MIDVAYVSDSRRVLSVLRVLRIFRDSFVSMYRARLIMAPEVLQRWCIRAWFMAINSFSIFFSVVVVSGELWDFADTPFRSSIVRLHLIWFSNARCAIAVWGSCAERGTSWDCVSFEGKKRERKKKFEFKIEFDSSDARNANSREDRFSESLW